jgi:hypothetical protein
MQARMKTSATKAGFIGNRAVEDYHAAHVEHLTAALPMPGVTGLTSVVAANSVFFTGLTSVNGFFSCPTCRTNPLTHARRSKVVEHMKKIAVQK